MLRNMLNDAEGDVKYSNNRLEKVLITAAYLLPLELNFATSYTIDVEQQQITPDPINQTDGPDFINFMVLKAACIIDEGNFRNAALLQGVQARCGPAILQTNNYGQQLKELLVEGPCKSYNTLKNEYNFGRRGADIIKAVMSPFVSNDFYTVDSTDWR